MRVQTAITMSRIMKTMGVALMLFAVLVGLALALPAPETSEGSEEEVKKVEEKREVSGSAGVAKRYDGSSCYGTGRWYKHGELFRSTACNSYRCEYGKFVTYEEGCEYNGRCYQRNQEFEADCARYRCTVTDMGSYKYYQVTPSAQQTCKDYYGSCRRPGDIFIYNVRGNLKRQCTCQIYGMTIHYICYD